MSQQENPFNNSELTTILVVSDMAISKSFYVDILGAELFREYGGDSTVLKFLNHWILIVTSGKPTKDKPDTFFNPPANKDQVSHSFTIRVDDCQKSYDILKKRGADFITSPYDLGQAVRCFFTDPEGHLFEIRE